MQKTLIWVVGAILALTLLGFGGRWYANRLVAERALTPRAMGSMTPASVKVPFTRMAIPSGDRTLIAWWVKAPPAGGTPAPAILFLHGNASSIADYVNLQRFWYRQGISSLVFDYTGFGASGGSASLPKAIEDARAVARMFADSAGKTTRKVAMGSALGATVLLQAIDTVQLWVAGIVVEGVDASVKEAGLRSGRLPKLIAPAIKDPADNVLAAAAVRVPTLFVHSKDDARAPVADAQRVAAAVTSKSSFIKYSRKGHSAILASSKPCDWARVLEFVRQGTLPAAKVDSTDVCAVEKATADSLAAHAAALAAAHAKAAASKKGGTKSGAKAPPPAAKTKTANPPKKNP